MLAGLIGDTKAPDKETTMLGFLLGGAIGYVLGTRAGRERYEQIERTCRQVIDHPTVQGAAGVISAKIVEVRGGRGRNGETP
ncbi:MAG TPA: hypothetical protein VGO16_02015 [Pseudonocardiaceae bacterium]|jgi:hypothetical protein|nr:hypothetical protein [Pseudonocardiaceae bacterium]